MYYKNNEGKLFQEPSAEFVQKHGLIQIDKAEFNSLLEQSKTPSQARLNQERAKEIDKRLSEIDLESVRPLRAITAGLETQEDRDKLTSLTQEAEALRAERALLV